MSTSKNWPISTGRDGVPIAVTSASAATRIVPAGDTGQLMAEDVMIDNPGPNDVFVRAGDATTLATAQSMRVPAGSLQPYGKGQTTHLACICPSGTQAIVVHVGEGV